MTYFIFQHTKEMWRDNKQFGFLPGNSTFDAILGVIDDFEAAIDRNDPIVAIFFDFAKAFDLVDHELLLKKISEYLPEKIVSWIAAYLTDRKQRVYANGIETEWKKVEAGVIQGSVLGPILFLLFIYDINKFIPANVNIVKYADDILAYVTGKHSDNLPQEIAKAVEDWCTVNKMRLNDSKCKVIFQAPKARRPRAKAGQPQIHLGAPYPATPPYITLNDNNGVSKPLEVVASYKYLGIQLTGELDWSLQCEKVLQANSKAPYLV